MRISVSTTSEPIWNQTGSSRPFAEEVGRTAESLSSYSIPRGIGRRQRHSWTTGSRRILPSPLSLADR